MSKTSEQRRYQILAAACKVFCSNSIESVSMAEIAQKAEIGKSTIYEYFASKNDLLIQAFLWIIQTMQEKVEAVFAEDAPLRTQMCRYMEAVIGGVKGAGSAENILKFVGMYGMDTLRHDVDAFQKAVLEQIGRGVRRAVDRGELPPDTEVERTALLLWALLNPMPIAYMRDAGVENCVEQAVDTVLYGLCPRRET